MILPSCQPVCPRWWRFCLLFSSHRDNLLSVHRARHPGKPLAGLRVLDVGCGGGLLSEVALKSVCAQKNCSFCSIMSVHFFYVYLCHFAHIFSLLILKNISAFFLPWSDWLLCSCLSLFLLCQSVAEVRAELSLELRSYQLWWGGQHQLLFLECHKGEKMLG